MSILNLMGRKRDGQPGGTSGLQALLRGFSIEVMPRTAARIDSFRDLLPAGTRVYIAHLDGTPIEDMVATARRIADEGYAVMPHFPARIIADAALLADWIARYQGEAGVRQALVLAGGVTTPVGAFDRSMQLLETGLFDKAGFTHLHVAGHPEGNRDIDTDGSTRLVDEAVLWKQKFTERTDAQIAMATQFAFEAGPVVDWANRLQAAGVTLPIHVGVAGPARLQTMLKFAVACGVGPSLRVLQRRARDVTRLVMPFEPTEVLSDLALHKATHPHSLIAQVHVFPLGGIRQSAEYLMAHGRAEPMAKSA